MAQIDTVFNYLRANYKENEPIFLSDVKVPGMDDVVIRQYIRQLTASDTIKRYDSGIYFFPRKTIFKSGSTLSFIDVINSKYLNDKEQRCGYVSGLMFANQLGITTQVPAYYEICTNKATTTYRETRLANQKVILKRPYAEITAENAQVLQFMDLLKEIDTYSELEGQELKDRINDYMKNRGINFDAMRKYLRYYPDKIYRNMYEMGLLNGISA